MSMSGLESMVFFFKRSKRPFYFPRRRLRFIRFSGQSFAFDYNSIGRFFYVLLEVGLKNQVSYKVPNFLHRVEALYSGMKVPYLQEDVFLFSRSYLFATPYSSKFVGYFPINFFNSIFLGVSFSKYSFGHHSLLLKKSAFKSTMQRVLVAVDSHLSLLFSGKPIAFPKGTNYITPFKFAMTQVYLISGDHNVSAYTARAEGPFLKFGGVSLRRYRDFFFKGFFRELRSFFLRHLFTLPLAPVYDMRLLDFFFDYFYNFVLKVVNYLSYLKLFLGSLAFFLHRPLVVFKYFIAEILYLVALALGQSFGLFYKLSFLRKFFFFFFRSFLFSGIFRGFFPSACSKISSLRFNRTPLFNDLAFAGGSFLNRGFSMRSYRDFIFKRVFFKSSSKRKTLLFWVDKLGEANRKKARWINYIFGYYRKKRKKASALKRFRKMQSKNEGLPGWLFPLSSRQELQLYNKPFALASSLYEGLRLTGGSAFGLKLHRFFPGVSTTADTWLAYKPSLFALMVDVCNRKAYRHYKREKKNLGLLRSSLLSLTEQLRPLLKKKGIKFSVPWYSTRRSPSLDLFGEKKIALAPYKGILRRAFNPRCLRPFNSGIPYSQRYLCPKILPKAVNFYDSLDHLRGGPSLAIKVRRLPKAREALLGRWSRAPSKFSFPLRFNLRNRKALFARAQRPFVIITQKLLRFLLFLFWQHRTQPSLSPLRVYYRLRRGRFAHLRKSFFNKRKRVLFLKRPTGLSPSHRRKFFVFTFGALFNSNPLRRRGTSRRREKLSKPLLENLKKQRFFFKGYSHCYFFNTSLDPFFLKSTCAYSARFFVLHWAFKSVLNISGVVTSKGAAFGLALKVYFLFAFSRISFLARRLVACLFSFLKFFPNNVSLDKDFARQRFFQKGFSFHFFLALRFFLLRQAMKSRFIKRLRLEKAKLPAQRGLLLSRRLPQGGAFKKSFPRGGSSNLVLSRGKKGFSQRSLPHKDLARGVGFKPIDKIFFARKPSASFVGLRPQKGLSLKKAHFVTSRKALVLARVARARFFYEKRQRLASRGLSKAVLKNTGKGPRVGSKITKNNGTFII